MSTEVPDWVRLACGRWGRQKRRIWTGKEWYVNPLGGKQQHVDGYAESIMGRIKDERVAAASDGARSQHWDEVYWGDALDVQRACIGMPEVPNDALHIKYVWDPEFGLSPRRKAEILGLKERAYWEAVGRAEFWIFARLSALQPTAKEVVVEVASPEVQQIAVASVAKLDFSTLNRPTLRLEKSAQA